MGSVLKSLFGSPKAKIPRLLAQPKPIDTAPVVETGEEGKKAKALRAALYGTAGGAQGQELMSGGVEKRQTLLGN